MKILFIKNSWIGSVILNYLNKQNIETYELDNFNNLKFDFNNLILNNNIDSVICAVEKSYGKNVYNTSYIENKLQENLHYNLELPLIITLLCKELNIHCTIINNGCIYESTDKIISENDMPNLFVSNHSIVSIIKERLLDYTNNECLNLRIRYPINGDFNPLCYLSKLFTYDKILNCDNSITIMPDILPIIIELISKRITGVFNLNNSNTINSLETLLNYKHTIDSNININEMSITEHDNIIGKRSNNIVSNSKLLNVIETIDLDSKKSLTNIISNMKNICRELKFCLCCKSENLKSILNLGYQPLANDFHKKNEYCNFYPLHLKYCNKCYHCQLSHAVNPDILFKNYKYVSGTSQTGLKFFKDNADMINNLFNSDNDKKILDIACNDGSQLNYFKELNWETHGIDPAKNLCPIAEEFGHKIVCDYFNEETAKKYYVNNNIKFLVITAQNVFAHTEFIDSFLQGCKLLMDNNSSLFIQTSQRDMIINGEFDTTYHEHISFYSTRSMRTLIERNGLILYKVREHSIHGRSFIFEIKLNNNGEKITLESELEEEKIGLYTPTIYDKFNLSAHKTINNLTNLIKEYRENNYNIIGYGAAAKGQTLICYGNIDLDYIIDENELKIGTYSPKLDIPIVSLNHFEQDTSKNILIIILAWNFADEIIRKIQNSANFKNKNIKFVKKYFPNIVCL